jgi:hypothetical protein
VYASTPNARSPVLHTVLHVLRACRGELGRGPACAKTELLSRRRRASNTALVGEEMAPDELLPWVQARVQERGTVGTWEIRTGGHPMVAGDRVAHSWLARSTKP